jgi:hypothetical protein
MASRIVGGTVIDLTDNPVSGAEVVITLSSKIAFSQDDSSSIMPRFAIKSESDGTWSTTVECNDTITPVNTTYEIKEHYKLMGWKVYSIQVLSTLGVGTNQVVDLIVP